MPPVQHFVRADVLPSGYLIRPCEGGGSIIHIVDHMVLEVCNCTYLYKIKQICSVLVMAYN